MRRQIRWALPIILVVAGFVAAALLIKFRQVAKPEPKERSFPLVRVVQAKRQPYRLVVHSQGTVQPRTEIAIVSEVSGKVSSVAASFTDGGFFKKGELLVEIDSRDYELGVIRAKAELARAELVLQREEAEAEIALKEWERLKRTEEPSSLLLRKPQRAEAEAAVASARAAVEQASRDLQRCRIIAPFDGRVRDEKVEPGEFVIKGALLGGIYSTDVVEVRLPLTLEQLEFLDLPVEYEGGKRKGKPAGVNLYSSIAGRRGTWHGEVVRTEGEINTRTRMINAVAHVAEPYKHSKTEKAPLAVGAFVEAEILGREINDAIALPRAAWREGNRVFLIKEGKLKFSDVEVITSTDKEIVLGAGLKEGDMVCVSPLDAVVEGMRVRILEEPARAK